MINRDNMTFIEHLEALRWALIRVFIVISTVMFFSFLYSDTIQNFILTPINDLE